MVCASLLGGTLLSENGEKILKDIPKKPVPQCSTWKSVKGPREGGGARPNEILVSVDPRVRKSKAPFIFDSFKRQRSYATPFSIRSSSRTFFFSSFSLI